MLYDRETLLYSCSCGFSFILRRWLGFARVPSLFYSVRKNDVRRGLREYSDVELELTWDAFCHQPSTEFAAAVFKSHCAYVAFFQVVSTRSAFAVRLFLLIFCGALSRSYASRSSCPSCRVEKFTAHHFFTCSRLGGDCVHELHLFCREEQWSDMIDLCLHRFRTFKLLLDDPSFSPDESSLFDTAVTPPC